jgi:hypothetical protein
LPGNPTYRTCHAIGRIGYAFYTPPPPTPKNENKNLGIGFFSFLKYIILYPESLLIPRQSLEKTIGWVATYCLVVHCGLEEGS